MGEKNATLPSASLVQYGPPVLPHDRIALMSPDDWQAFTTEWADSLRPKLYGRVERHSGAGDKGIDVCAFDDAHAKNCPWDNYQCKHYEKPLTPGDVWVELAKVIYYTWRGEYTVPRRYYFCAPRDVGSKLAKLLRKPNELKAQLRAAWPTQCENKIQSTPVQLADDLADHFDKFDFSIFTYKPVAEIIEQHRKTPNFALRFGGGLPERKTPGLPPAAIAAKETIYVNELLSAYGDHLSKKFATAADLPDGTIKGHFERSRREFYCAECLREFSLDNLPTESYPQLEDQIYSGIVDVVEDDHADGFARVKAAVKQAKLVQIDSHPLKDRMNPSDRAGICHQLANKGFRPFLQV